MTNKTTAQQTLDQLLDQWYKLGVDGYFMPDQLRTIKTALEAMADSEAVTDVEALKRELHDKFMIYKGEHSTGYRVATKAIDEIVDHLNQRGLIATGWRDISTAPKDGSRVLLFCPFDGVMQAEYFPGQRMGRHKPGWRVYVDKYQQTESNEGLYENPPIICTTASHWMPLPPSPKTDKQGQSDE